MRWFRVGVPMILLCAALSVSAQSDKCQNANTTLDMVQCQAKELQERNDDLKVVLSRIEKLADQRQRDLLKRAETAWEAYRDANCTFASDLFRGGSMQGLVVAECQTRLAEERIEELEELRQDLEER